MRLVTVVAALTTHVLARSELNTATASADATVTFDPVTFYPSIIYQSNVAGQVEVPVTYSTYVTGSSTTEAYPTATASMPFAAFQVSPAQIAYELPLRAKYPLVPESIDEISPALAMCWYPISVRVATFKSQVQGTIRIQG